MNIHTFSAIVAQDARRCIGLKGSIPWKISSDLKRFRLLTVGKVCLMGRKTYESLPRPLPNRYHLVVSSTLDGDPDRSNRISSHGEVVGSLGEAVWDRVPRLIHEGWHSEVMIIGGGQIYHQTLPITSRVYLTTLVDREVEGDTFFPFLPPEDWEILHLENVLDDTYGTVKFSVLQRTKGLVHP